MTFYGCNKCFTLCQELACSFGHWMSRCLISLLFSMVEIAEFLWKRLYFNHQFMTQMLISCIRLFNLPQIQLPHAPFYKYPGNCSVFLHPLWGESLGAPKLVLSASNVCIKCKQKTPNGTSALCGLGILLAFRGRKRSLCWGGGACSESCRAMPESGKLSWDIPENRSLRRSQYFLGRSAAVNPGGQLDGDRIVPDFPSTAPSVVVLDPIILSCSFSLEQVLETLGGGTVLVWSLWLWGSWIHTWQ